jgi:L-alanine-DL-glutamate epimerase-like enolase superfamily enzyme
MATIERATAHLIEYKLERSVGGSGVAAVDVILVRLENSDGLQGLGFSYVLGGGGSLCFAATQNQLSRYVRSQAVPPPRAMWKTISRGFNRTGLGPNLIGLAAIDVAMWDLHARRQNVPLGVAMGGEPRDVPVYGSGGFNTVQSEAEAADVAQAYLARGFRAVKPRVAGTPKDERVIKTVQQAVGDDVTLMLDANEKCDLVSANRLLCVARDYGVLFVEEPLPWSSVGAYPSLNRAVTLAGGEHAQDYSQLAALMRSGTLGLVQPDLAMIGGLTPVLDICVVAEALGATVSPHFLHGLFVHVATASPAISWLEDFPLLEPLFDGWPITAEGKVSNTATGGHGLRLSELGESLSKSASQS